MRGFIKTRRIIAIFIVLLFIGGNGALANEASSSDSEKQILINIEETDIEKGIIDEIDIIEKEETGISINNRRLIEKLPSTMGTPSGKIVNKDRANSHADKLGYDNAHKFKTEMVKGQKDTTIAHYNMFEVTKTKKPFKVGDILLEHTKSRTLYITHHNIFSPDGIRQIES